MKMKKQLWVGIGAGLLGLLATASYIGQREGAILKITEGKSVVRAKKDIAAGSWIDASMVEAGEVPAPYLEPKVLAKPEEVIGRVALGPIAKGSQITKNFLTSLKDAAALPVRIPRGMRAVTVALDSSTGSAGLVLPNQFVDVTATFEVEDATEQKQSMTFTIAQNILVLAVGNQTFANSSPDKKSALGGGLFGDAVSGTSQKTITLAATPEQSQELIFAEENGALHFILRPQWEEASNPVGPTSASSLLGVRGYIRKENYREYRGR